jgi:hypothetical protein
MGECGCGELRPLAAFRVGDEVLVVELYGGCTDCHSWPSVGLHVMTPEQAAELSIEVGGEFRPGPHGWERQTFPIITKEGLRLAAEEVEGEGGDLLDAYISLEDLLTDRGLHLLRAAMRRSREEGAGRETPAGQ